MHTAYSKTECWSHRWTLRRFMMRYVRLATMGVSPRYFPDSAPVNRLKRTITFQFPDFRTVSLPHDSIVIPVADFGTWPQNQKTSNSLKLRA